MGTEWVENDELSQVEEGNDKAKILNRGWWRMKYHTLMS